MIPYLLAAVGGYLLGDSMKDSQSFAKGGGIKSFMYKVHFKNSSGDFSKETFSAENLKDLKEQIISKFGNTDKVSMVEKFDLKHRRYFIVESTRSNLKNKRFAEGGIMAKGGKAKERYLHIFKLKYPNYNKIYVYDGDESPVLSTTDAMNKLGIQLVSYYGISPTSYKYSGVPSTSDKYKKWYQLKKKDYTDEKAYKKVFEDTEIHQGSQYEDGGETDDDMSIQFIDYKDKTIMFEPHNKEYFTNDIEFKSLADAKKYIDAGSPDPSWQKFVYSQGLMADGGSIVDMSFNDIETEIEYFNPSKESMIVKMEIDFTDKSGMEDYGEREYKFELLVDDEGYSIYKIFNSNGVQVSKEEQNFLESSAIIIQELDNAIEQAREIYSEENYDKYYADGGVIKEYLFNFIGGGYNTVSAKNKREAIKIAKKKYEDNKSKIDEKSFRISTKEDLKRAESMFI
jgi:hypothetical protein